MFISDEVIDSYYICKLKAQYKFFSIEYSDPAYYHHNQLLKKNSSEQFQRYLAKNNIKYQVTSSLDQALNINVLVKNFECSIGNNSKITYPFIEIINNEIIPIYISSKYKISSEYKKSCSTKSSILSDFLTKKISYYKIIFPDGCLKKFKVIEQRDGIEIINNNLVDNDIHKSKHCSSCEYKTKCLSTLTERDDLRLLGSMSEKEVLTWNKKGYFSIHQLSYYYKPRRRSLITSTRSRYKHELKSLAIKVPKSEYLNTVFSFT